MEHDSRKRGKNERNMYKVNSARKRTEPNYTKYKHALQGYPCFRSDVHTGPKTINQNIEICLCDRGNMEHIYR